MHRKLEENKPPNCDIPTDIEFFFIYKLGSVKRNIYVEENPCTVILSEKLMGALW